MSYVYYEQLVNRFYSKLRNIGSSTVNCSISIGSIIGFFGKNCNIEIVNACLNNQTIINNLLLESLSEVLDTITDTKLKEYIINYLGININNIIDSTFQETCNALSLVNNNINILQLNFAQCNASTPITLSFINTGEAYSSCGLSAILNAFINYESINENVEIVNKDTSFLIYIGIGLSIATAIIIVILHLKKRKEYIYLINTKQKYYKPKTLERLNQLYNELSIYNINNTNK